MNETPDTSAVKIEVFMGHMRIESRLRPEGNKLIGEGRSWEFDRQGKLIRDSGWQPTGVVVTLPEEEGPWWASWW